jgi:pimeloyl-ACP methyl ester carboxylesterase
MTQMRDGRVRCLSPAGFHELAYVAWGDTDNPKVLFCVHGLTRCSRDFDDLARAMAADYRVICPDIVGRGRSDWLRDKQHYQIPQYCADVTTLLAHVDGQSPITDLHWVGTSMGGLIGMALAAAPDSPIQKLVLNDVGPVVSAVSVARIGDYLGKAPRFANVEQAEALVRAVSAPFGPLTDKQWRHLTEHVVKTAADGAIEFRYDPGIAQPFATLAQANGGKDMELWPIFDAIRCPTLLVRGAASDLLTAATAQAMTTRGPKAQLVEFAGIGHAPVLMDADQIAPIRDFLLNRR